MTNKTNQYKALTLTTALTLLITSAVNYCNAEPVASLAPIENQRTNIAQFDIGMDADVQELMKLHTILSDNILQEASQSDLMMPVPQQVILPPPMNPKPGSETKIRLTDVELDVILKLAAHVHQYRAGKIYSFTDRIYLSQSFAALGQIAGDGSMHLEYIQFGINDRIDYIRDATMFFSFIHPNGLIDPKVLVQTRNTNEVREVSLFEPFYQDMFKRSLSHWTDFYEKYVKNWSPLKWNEAWKKSYLERQAKRAAGLLIRAKELEAKVCKSPIGVCSGDGEYDADSIRNQLVAVIPQVEELALSNDTLWEARNLVISLLGRKNELPPFFGRGRHYYSRYGELPNIIADTDRILKNASHCMETIEKRALKAEETMYIETACSETGIK